MDTSAYIESIERDARAVADVASRGLDAVVPSCPGWDVGDLTAHLGEAYAFVADVLGRRTLERPGDPTPPGRAVVMDWYADSLNRLLKQLRHVPPDAPTYNWSLEPKTARFWPRRMALESLVHRWDADSAYGEQSPIDPQLAADGIDEVLCIWKPVARLKENGGVNGTVHFHCTDIDGEWLVHLDDGGMSVTSEHAKGDAAARGRAEDLLLALWGRRPFASLETFGDTALLEWSSRVEPAVFTRAVFSPYARIRYLVGAAMTRTATWDRLLYVRTADPVRRALNRGLLVVILVYFFVSLLLVPILLVSGEPAAAAANAISLFFTFLIWRLTRSGSTLGAILYVGLMIVELTYFVSVNATTIAAGDAAIPLVLAFPVVIAAAFIRPAAGLVALVLQMTGVAVVLAASDLPDADVVRFVAVGSLNLLALGALVMVGASMCIHAIRAETEANAAVRASEERYRALYEDSPSMFFTIDADGIVVSVNEFAAAQLGYETRELLHSSAYDMYEPSERGRAAGHIAGVLRDRGRVVQWEIEKCRKDGSGLVVSETAKAVSARDGSTVVLIVGRDITEQRRAEFDRVRLEMELRQVQKLDAIGRLAGGTAHDFNNLLSVISGYTQMLDSELVGHPMHGDVKEMQRAVKSATELTRQLLAFSRRQEVRAQNLDLNDIVTDMSRLLRRIIGHDVDLETQLEPSLGWTTADRNQLEQVILNLSVNARDAMPAGGLLILKTANVDVRDKEDAVAAGCPELAAGSYVAMSVTDTGVGMDAELRKRVFEPFFTTKESGSGTGLGLSTVFGVVEKSGGKIAVHSRPDEGTTFTVFLPRTVEAKSAASTATGAIASGDG